MHQSRIAVFVHVTWATWDRLPLLVGEVEQSVYRAIGAKCAEISVDLIALGGTDDQLHMLIRLPSSISLGEIVGQVKGAAAHLITHTVTPYEFFKWQGGYGAFSVSVRNLQQACDYINHQRNTIALARSTQPLNQTTSGASMRIVLTAMNFSLRRQASWRAAASHTHSGGYPPRASALGAARTRHRPRPAAATGHRP